MIHASAAFNASFTMQNKIEALSHCQDIKDYMDLLEKKVLKGQKNMNSLITDLPKAIGGNIKIELPKPKPLPERLKEDFVKPRHCLTILLDKEKYKD